MMKVFFSVALAAILFAGTANAQHSSQKVTIGVKGGVNLFNVHNDDGTKWDNLVGFNAGLLAHIHVVPHLALQPEIVYSAQGAKNIDGTSTKLNLGYINVPVLLQYMFDNGFRVEAGPQLGFLANAKYKAGGTSVDLKDSYKSVDFGVAAGISYVQPSTGFGLDLRYNLGLSNINESNVVKSTNRGGQLGVFYLFNHRH